MNLAQPNLFSFAFVDPTMFSSTMTLKYGRHFQDNTRPAELSRPPYQDCEHIMLRGPASDAAWALNAPQVECPLMKDWPSARNLIDAIQGKIAENLGAENLQLGRVYVESIRQGGFIGWHADETAYAKAHQRFRMIVSPCAGGCWFSAGETLAPGPGNLTYFNNRALHSAINLGPIPQISIVLDVRRPPLQ